MKIKNLTNIRKSHYENIAKLMIECHLDFEKGYTLDTLHKIQKVFSGESLDELSDALIVEDRILKLASNE